MRPVVVGSNHFAALGRRQLEFKPTFNDLLQWDTSLFVNKQVEKIELAEMQPVSFSIPISTRSITSILALVVRCTLPIKLTIDFHAC